MFAEKLESIRVGEEMKGLTLVTKAAHSPQELQWEPGDIHLSVFKVNQHNAKRWSVQQFNIYIFLLSSHSCSLCKL